MRAIFAPKVPLVRRKKAAQRRNHERDHPDANMPPLCHQDEGNQQQDE
jgi:hypothetical protein